jgi:hypothetical protein
MPAIEKADNSAGRARFERKWEWNRGKPPAIETAHSTAPRTCREKKRREEPMESRVWIDREGEPTETWDGSATPVLGAVRLW